MSQATSHTTTNHKQIQKWVEERGGHPARVKGTEKGKSSGVLRIDYPGFNPPALTGPLLPLPAGNLDSEERGITYSKPSEVPISRGGEVEDEAVPRRVSKR